MTNVNKKSNKLMFYEQLRSKAGQYKGYLAKNGLYGKTILMKDYMVKVQVIKNMNLLKMC